MNIKTIFVLSLIAQMAICNFSGTAKIQISQVKAVVFGEVGDFAEYGNQATWYEISFTLSIIREDTFHMTISFAEAVNISFGNVIGLEEDTDGLLKIAKDSGMMTNTFIITYQGLNNEKGAEANEDSNVTSFCTPAYHRLGEVMYTDGDGKVTEENTAFYMMLKQFAILTYEEDEHEMNFAPVSVQAILNTKKVNNGLKLIV